MFSLKRSTEISMMSTFRYLYHLCGVPGMLWKVYRQLRAQKAFMQKELLRYLDEVEKKQDGTIREADLKKIKQYYGLAVPALLAEGYAALRGTPLSEKERNAATYLGATTGLFDDFFEDTQLQDSYITQLYRHPETYTGQNDNEKLANHCWGKALEGCRSKDLLIHYAGKVHAAQIASRLQTTTQPDTQTLQQITFDKGGYSVLFYMALFYENFPADDEKLFYNAGALLQLENDVFDVYKDDKDGICTLATHPHSIQQLTDTYLALWKQVQQSISVTRYSLPGKKAFEKMLAAIVSRGFVCLHMLQEREKQNKGNFNPGAFTRKQLICDMEKPINLLRTLHHYARIL